MKGKWTQKTLGDIAHSIRGVSYKPEQLRKGYESNTVILLRATNIQNHKFLLTDLQFVPAEIVNDDQVCKQFDIVMCMSNGSKNLVGKSAQFQHDASMFTCGSFCSIIRSKDKSNAKFVFVLVNSFDFQKQLDITLSGSAINNLQNSQLDQFCFNIPEYPEDQQHIADILTSCDEVIEQTEKAIEKYRSIKAGMLQNLFTRGVDANGKLRPRPEDAPELYKESPLGKIPKEWAIKTIGQCCSEPMYGLNAPAIPFDQKHRYIRITDISDISHKYLKDDVVSPAFYSDQYLVAEGDILFARTGASVGKTYIFDPCDSPLYFAGFLIRFRVNQDYNPYYIFYQTETFVFLNWVSIMSVRTGQPGVNSTEYSTFQMPMPSKKSEQDMIAKRLSSIDAKIETEEQILAKYRSIKLGLMKKLLTPPEGALEA